MIARTEFLRTTAWSNLGHKVGRGTIFLTVRGSHRGSKRLLMCFSRIRITGDPVSKKWPRRVAEAVFRLHRKFPELRVVLRIVGLVRRWPVRIVRRIDR
jgi:hypothetical protein